MSAADKLVVVLNPHDGPTRERTLLVDAVELMDDPGKVGPVRYWVLVPVYGVPLGQWRHPESGMCGPLAEMLSGIAATYLEAE